jgi:hypothetical protein
MGYFPEVFIEQMRRKYRGTIGLRLESLLRGDLLLSDTGNRRDSEIAALNRMNPKFQQKAREAFLQALAGLPETLTLELHLHSQPNLANRAGSRLEITLILVCEATSQNQVKEELLSCFLALKPLLATHLPEADFQPICEAEELQGRMTKAGGNRAITIGRRREEVALSSLVKNRAIGFTSALAAGGQQQPEELLRHTYPWDGSHEDWSDLLGLMLNQTEPVRIIIRLRAITAEKGSLTRLNETVSTCDRFLAATNNVQASLAQRAQAIRDQARRQLTELAKAAFQVGIFLLTDTDHRFLARVLGKAITGLGSRGAEDEFDQGGFSIVAITVKRAMQSDCLPDPEPFTVIEAACAFRLPSPPFEDFPGLPLRRFRTSQALLPPCREGNQLTMGVNEHQGHIQKIQVGLEDRFRHCFIIGQTGTGKSTLMENMILQDIQDGRGVAVIDPHGEMVESILGRIPKERADEVIYFNPLDTDRPLGFNILEWKTIEERDLIIDDIYQTLDRIYDMHTTGGPIFEHNFRGMLKLLMGDGSRKNFVPTLLEFTMCYQDEEFREYLAQTNHDPQVHDFLQELQKAGGDASLKNISPYITSKFSRFIQDTILRRIIGQAKSSFDFDQIMAQGKIVLINLGKGRFGSTTAALLANMLVSRFKQAAMHRAVMKPSERRPFFLYVDEAHNLPAENFMELLSEARKYKLGLVLATQYAAQLSRTGFHSRDNLLSAILGNVGQTIIFRLGQEDAAKMAPALYPSFSEQDIMGLPNWHGYARMQLNNEAISPFSFKTTIADEHYNGELARKIISLSRLKYGLEHELVDGLIKRRRSAWHKPEMAIDLSET